MSSTAAPTVRADDDDSAVSARLVKGKAAWAAGTVVAAVALFACYLRQSRTISVGSDGASQALQAWDMLHGNLLLHGWWVTDVSFYTTELPQYAAIELVRGLSADVMHVAGAMTYTLLVLAAAFLARGRATGAPGLARALLAAGIMLAPQLGPGTQALVLSPDHTGTGVPVLLSWLLIDRAPARWYVPVLVWLGLALTALADAMALFVAIIPLAVVCALRVAPGVVRGGVRSTEAWRERRCELALLAAAVLAVPAELAATALIRAHGGWQVNGLSTGLAGVGALPGNARLTGQGLLELFGADVFGAAATGSALAVAFAVVHLVGVALAVAALIAAARRFLPRAEPAEPREPAEPTERTESPAARVERAAEAAWIAGASSLALAGSTAPDTAAATTSVARTGSPVRSGRSGRTVPTTRTGLIEAVLLTGIVIDVAAYLAGVQAVNISSTREIAPVLPFAAVLAGRLLGERLLGGRAFGGRAFGGRVFGERLRPALRYGLCGVLALYAAMLGYAAAQPPAAPQYADLAAWLPAHQLTAGLSGYHQANIVTLESGGAVTLRAVTATSGGKVGAYTWNASTTWFDPGGHTANFLVLTAPGVSSAAGGSGMTAAEATATFGRPTATYRYQGFAILVWPRGDNLLARLR